MHNKRRTQTGRGTCRQLLSLQPEAYFFLLLYDSELFLDWNDIFGFVCVCVCVCVCVYYMLYVCEGNV